jgi:hypothetical protein
MKRTVRILLDAWLKEVGAQVPVPNPAYNPALGTPKVPASSEKKTE